MLNVSCDITQVHRLVSVQHLVKALDYPFTWTMSCVMAMKEDLWTVPISLMTTTVSMEKMPG